MAQQTFYFRQPKWQLPQQRNIETVALLIGSILWFVLYLWLCRRLWQIGIANVFRLGDALSLVLIMTSIVLGVPLVLTWRRVGKVWMSLLKHTESTKQWAALTQEEAQRLTPSDFEEYVAQRIFARQGYIVHNMPDVKDGGVDILVTDTLGQQAVVQCKRYKGTVGEPTVRDLFGTMIHTRAVHAYLVTTGRISNDARKWAEDKPIELIDGTRLEELALAIPKSDRNR